MSANFFGTSKDTNNFDLSASVTGTKKTPEQIAEEKRNAAAGEDGIEMKEMGNKQTRRTPFYNNSFIPAGGRRRKSRRGKSRKYKRTLKRRKNKTKNRK